MVQSAARMKHVLMMQFGISANVVKYHLSTIFAKIGITNRTETAAYALECHLTKS